MAGSPQEGASVGHPNAPRYQSASALACVRVCEEQHALRFPIAYTMDHAAIAYAMAGGCVPSTLSMTIANCARVSRALRHFHHSSVEYVQSFPTPRTDFALGSSTSIRPADGV